MRRVYHSPLLFYAFAFAMIILHEGISEAVVPQRNYTNCMVVDYGYNLRLYWTVISSTNIQMAMSADVTGYISLGFSTDGTMGNGGKGADAWAASNGIFYDLWMRSEDQPTKDTNQATNLVYTQQNGTLIVEWDRPLNTGDNRDYQIILNDTMPLIWALNPTSKVRTGEDIPEHKRNGVLNAGARSVHFGRNSSCEVTQGNNSWTSPDGTFRLLWEILDDTYINFTMQADTKGWLSLGLSTSPRMTNADMYTGWVANTGGAVTLLDTWSPDYNQPREDTSLGGTKDILTFSGSQTTTTTEIKFSRKLITGDTKDVDITDQNLYVLYGWNPSDGTGTTYSKHTAVGAGIVNFKTGSTGGTGGGGGSVVPTNVTDPTGAEWNSPSGKFTVKWDMDTANKAIILQMRGKTQGWISFGICQDAKMPNCDFWTAWVDDQTGATTLLDTWSPNYNTPNTDAHSDLTILGAKQEAGWTIITFSRNWTTGDSDDIDIKNQYQYVGWALHSSKDGDSTTGLYSQHTSTGMTQINFFTGKSMDIKDRDPGTYLAIVVVASLGCVGAIHTGYKGYKGYLRKKDDDEDEGETNEIELDSHNNTEVHYHRNKTNEHYVGSQKVAVAPSTDLKTVKADSSTPAPIGQKKRKMSLFSIYDGLFEARIPKTKLSVGMTIVAFIFVAVNMLCTMIAITDRWSLKFGSILAANCFFVAVPATRNSFLVWFLGIPFDRAITYHRWLGRWCLILGILHLSFMLSEWQDLKMEITEEIATKQSIYGLAALGVLVIMFISTLEPIRRKQFEIFYYLHFVFIAFYVLAWFHVDAMRPWIIATAVVYLLDRFLRFAWGIVPQKTAVLKLKGDPKDGILQLRFRKNILARLFGMYDVGQYVFVNFPTISFLEWHPFSISSAPGESTLEVHIKGIGNHTNKLLEAAQSKQHLWIRVDGPYGHLRMTYQRFPVVVLICGGIGITPMLSMVREVCKTGERDPKYKQKKSFVENLYFIWAVQSQAQYDWFATELSECYAAEGTRKDVPRLNFMIYITRGQQGELDANFIKGRPQFNEIFGAITKEHPGKAVASFVCGPKQMVNGVWDAVNSKRRDGHDIHFHKETFEF